MMNQHITGPPNKTPNKTDPQFMSPRKKKGIVKNVNNSTPTNNSNNNNPAYSTPTRPLNKHSIDIIDLIDEIYEQDNDEEELYPTIPNNNNNNNNNNKFINKNKSTNNNNTRHVSPQIRQLTKEKDDLLTRITQLEQMVLSLQDADKEIQMLREQEINAFQTILISERTKFDKQLSKLTMKLQDRDTLLLDWVRFMSFHDMITVENKFIIDLIQRTSIMVPMIRKNFPIELPNNNAYNMTNTSTNMMKKRGKMTSSSSSQRGKSRSSPIRTRSNNNYTTNNEKYDDNEGEDRDNEIVEEEKDNRMNNKQNKSMKQTSSNPSNPSEISSDLKPGTPITINKSLPLIEQAVADYKLEQEMSDIREMSQTIMNQSSLSPEVQSISNTKQMNAYLSHQTHDIDSDIQDLLQSKDEIQPISSTYMPQSIPSVQQLLADTEDILQHFATQSPSSLSHKKLSNVNSLTNSTQNMMNSSQNITNSTQNMTSSTQNITSSTNNMATNMTTSSTSSIVRPATTSMSINGSTKSVGLTQKPSQDSMVLLPSSKNSSGKYSRPMSQPLPPSEELLTQDYSSSYTLQELKTSDQLVNSLDLPRANTNNTNNANNTNNTSTTTNNNNEDIDEQEVDLFPSTKYKQDLLQATMSLKEKLTRRISETTTMEEYLRDLEVDDSDISYDDILQGLMSSVSMISKTVESIDSDTNEAIVGSISRNKETIQNKNSNNNLEKHEKSVEWDPEVKEQEIKLVAGMVTTINTIKQHNDLTQNTAQTLTNNMNNTNNTGIPSSKENINVIKQAESNFSSAKMKSTKDNWWDMSMSVDSIESTKNPIPIIPNTNINSTKITTNTISKKSNLTLGSDLDEEL